MATLLPIGAGQVATIATFYKASELLGVGRYSEVYKAFDTHSQCDVALKLYVGSDGATHELAKSEESVLARLGQLNSEYFPRLRRGAKHRIRNQNHPLLVLELGAYLRGDGQKSVISLKQIITHSVSKFSGHDPDEDFWSADCLTDWIIHMAQAVKLLHSVGIVHRDIKPANILLKRGPGQSQAVPFFLDFNSASGSGAPESGTGTPRYLPPEVKLGKRKAPCPEDDLWAIAMVAWEMLHGESSSPEQCSSPTGMITGELPDGLLSALRRALSLNPEGRFPTAEVMLSELEAAATIKLAPGLALRSDEVARARSAMERIRRAMSQALAPPGEIVIPKEIEDSVTTVIAWLSQSETQSLNLVEELTRLGPVAIPAILEQGYRLQNHTSVYDEVVEALGKLGAQDPQTAQLAIEVYALSSNIGVRALCWRTCEQLEYFPELLLDSLTADEGVLLPEERLQIADLCIRYGTNAEAVLALVKYICREYILDRDRYSEICRTVARRMNELKFPETARLIWEDCQSYIWEELKEFNRIPGRISFDPVFRDSATSETERGLLELLAEAFASTGSSGLEILKSHKAQRLAGKRKLPIFRRFAVKSAGSNPEVRAWVLGEAKKYPDDQDFQRIAEKLAKKLPNGDDDPGSLLREYLQTGSQPTLNKLRFWPDTRVLELVKTKLANESEARRIELVLRLLKGFQTRHRALVVDVMVTHWKLLSGCSYDRAIEVLTGYKVPNSQRARAVSVLDQDLAGARGVAARRGLEQLLR